MSKRVALVFICLNPLYWQYLYAVYSDAKKNFLPGHQTDFFLWTDIPELNSKEYNDLVNSAPTNAQLEQAYEEMNKMQAQGQDVSNIFNQLKTQVTKELVVGSVHNIRNDFKGKIIPTAPAQWPIPTLMRYHLFLQEKEELAKYDYIFYLDADMRIVDVVGEEILGQGLTMAEHPMYALRSEYIPPYEPNVASTAFIRRLGGVITDTQGKPRFKPLYAAGGFQGGLSAPFIEAMEEMRKNIDKDFNNNYTAIWNDESHWNAYLYKYIYEKGGNLTILNPSYVYPDSLIEEYYVKLWGCNYQPKIVTLTKKFSTSKTDGAALKSKLGTM